MTAIYGYTSATGTHFWWRYDDFGRVVAGYCCNDAPADTARCAGYSGA